ncbi:MAG: hypothetical protein WC846_02090 [Candidatus Gracilibacteria bacterium]|jgi:hypothetical protein
MKKTIVAMLSLLSIAALLLTSCGGPDLTGVDQSTINLHSKTPELVQTWQTIEKAAQGKDCATILSYMRKSLNLTEQSCPAAYDYFKNAPEVDWNKTDWTADEGKAKIYELDKGSITSLIYDGRDEIWRVDTEFWAE